MELVPHRGTRREFMAETFARGGKVSLWLPHIRRVRWCRQARRLIDDHKRGARLAAAATAQAVCAAARQAALARAREAAPRLDALRIVAVRNPWLNVGIVAAAAATPPPPPEVIVPSSNGDDQLYAVVFNLRRIPLTLAALVRLAERDEADGAAASAVAEAEAALTAATGKLRTSEQVHELMRLTMTVSPPPLEPGACCCATKFGPMFVSRWWQVQSDYASQFETHRIHTATCAQPERHNLLVSIVGYKPYTEMMPKSGRRRKNVSLEPVLKQHVDIFYAFHKAGFKPSARSFNVVQVHTFPLHACTFHCMHVLPVSAPPQ